VCCSVLQCVAVCCSVLQCGSILSSMSDVRTQIRKEVSASACAFGFMCAHKNACMDVFLQMCVQVYVRGHAVVCVCAKSPFSLLDRALQVVKDARMLYHCRSLSANAPST